MSAPVIIHLGFPKTATTTLQAHVLSRLPSVHYLGKFDGKPPTDGRIAHFHSYVTGLVGIEPHERLLSTRNATDVLREGPAKGLVSVISKEELLIACIGPRPEPVERRKLLPAMTLQDIVPPLVRFCQEAGLGQPRFVVTLREQADLLSSFYAQMALTRYRGFPEAASFGRFIGVFLDQPELSGAALLDYPDLATQMDELAGPGNYRLIAHEWLSHDPERYLAAWVEALGVPHEEVRSAFATSRAENVRRVSGADGRAVLKFEAPSGTHLLAFAKARLLPNHSLGIGRMLRRLLGHYRLPSRSYQPDEGAIAAIRAHYRASNDLFLRQRPEFSAMVGRAGGALR